MYNREKVVEIIVEGICRSDEYNYNYLLEQDGIKEMANSVVDFMIEVGFLNFDKTTGAITEAAHFANTDVGRSAACDDTSNNSDVKAASSETSVVGQNEQTKELCQCVIGHNTCECWEYNECSICGKPLH